VILRQAYNGNVSLMLLMLLITRQNTDVAVAAATATDHTEQRQQLKTLMTVWTRGRRQNLLGNGWSHYCHNVPKDTPRSDMRLVTSRSFSMLRHIKL